VPIDQSIPLVEVDLIVDSIEQYYYEDDETSTGSGRLLKGKNETKEKSKKPAEDLNLYGGDELLIQGTGFSSDLEGSEVEFEDETKCKITKSFKKYLECTVEGFKEGVVQVAQELEVTVSSKKSKSSKKKKRKNERGSPKKSNKKKKAKTKN